MLNRKTLLFVIISLLLAACGAQSTSAGDPRAGEELFNQGNIDAAPACNACHSTQPDQVIVGPSLAGIANRADQRVPGETGEEYLHKSILEPNRYVVEGFSSGLMYQNYKEVLTEDQIRDLIAYLSTLK